MYFDVTNHFNFDLILPPISVMEIEDMKIFPLSDSVLATFTPTIAGILTNYLRLTTQKIYINLGAGIDKNVTQPPLNLVIRRLPTARYQYISPIAHQLAATLGLTPLEICQNFQRQIEPLHNHGSPVIEVRCWYTDAGYIHFQLAPTMIAMWLNWIQDGSREWLTITGLRESETSNSIKKDKVNSNCQTYSNFAQSQSSLALYTHARCCSLLRLARTEKIISCDNFWQITTPNWLICDLDRSCNCSITDQKFIFDTGVEDKLIHALMDVLDGIYGDRPQNWSKLALNLAQSWLEFNRSCQIFGDLQRQNPRLAIARCGLTAISRRYLQVLLEDYLGVTALTEL
jgi:hypothetical protein